MPIINRRDEGGSKPEEKRPIISNAAPAAAPIGNASEQLSSPTGGKRRSASPWVAAFVITLLVAGSATAGFRLIQAIPNAETVKIDRERIEQTAERMVRIQSLISLLDKRIDNSQTALKSAEDRRDQVMVDTLRLTLAQNLSDRKEHLDEMLTSLIDLGIEYDKDPNLTTKILREFIDQSKSEYKAGRIEAVGNALQILKSAPGGEDKKTHIKKSLGLE